MDIFSAFRQLPGPTLYSARSLSPVDHDVQQLTLYFIIGALIIFSIFSVFGGIHIKEQIKKTLTLMVAMIVGSSIVLCITSIEWKYSTANSRVQYRSYSGDTYNVTLELSIGLKTFNITMKEEDGLFRYNEEFLIDIAHHQRAAKKETIRRGLPLPIVALSEYMSADAAGFTWGRWHRLAGQYTHLFMWASFGLWLLACLQFPVSIKSGSITTLLTGVFQLMAIVIYVALQPYEMIIPFPDEVLIMYQWRFGYAFWWTVVTGLCCLALGIILTCISHLFQDKLASILGLDGDAKCDSYDHSEDNTQSGFNKGHQDLRNLNGFDLQKINGQTPDDLMIDGSVDSGMDSSCTSSGQDGRRIVGYDNFSYTTDEASSSHSKQEPTQKDF